MSAHLRGQMDVAVHRAHILVGKLHLLRMDVGMLVPDHTATDDIDFLLLAPAATHVDELGILKEQFVQTVGIPFRHPGPLLIREVDQLLLFFCKLLLCNCCHTADGKHND